MTPRRSIALETIRAIASDGKERVYVGEVQAEDADGGVLILEADGQLHPCSASRIIERRTESAPFTPLTHQALGEQIIKELGPGFQVYKTEHYVIVHNTNDPYVRWCASLFERLFRGFYNYWKTRGMKLVEPRFPLVAVIFNGREGFEKYSAAALGDSVSNMIGYYNMQTNRTALYYLPNAERRVATIIHEAAHQLSYNSGLQVRLAENPLWVSEGLAVYFEAPDLSNSRGWGTIGKVNTVNLQRFHGYLGKRDANSLATLIQNDARFSEDPEAAYGEAWSLNYFLLKAKGKQYTDYLRRLSQRRPLETLDPRQRLDDFTASFGDLRKFDTEFLKFMASVR
jgi:hypothetical protein